MQALEGQNIVVYDCEIKNVIDGIGITWNDHDKMGLSVACLFDYETGDYNVYFDKDVQELTDRLNRANLCIGFNTTGFDDKLIKGSGGLNLTPKSWDILYHSRRATGWNEGMQFPKGLRLDDHLFSTFGESFMKTQDGADAPLMYQQGKLGTLVSYCLADVRREKTLFEHIYTKGWVSTKTHGQKKIDTSKIIEALQIL